VNLYPIAETTAVLNPSTNAADGYFGVAPYIVAFTNGDTVEQFHWPWQQVSYSGLTARQELPLPPYTAFTMGYDEEVGDNFTSYAAHNEKNNTAITKYQGYGGTMPLGAGTIAYNVQGPFGVLLNNYGPAPDFAIINNPNCKAAPIGCSNAALSPIAIYSGAASQEKIWDNTALNSIDFGGMIRLNHGSFSMGMYSPTFGTIAATEDQSSSPTPDGTFQGTFNTPGIAAGCAQWDGSANLGSTSGNCISGTVAANVIPKSTGGSSEAASALTDNGATVASSETITTPSLLASGVVDGTAPMTVTTGSSATLGGTYNSGYTLNQNATAATAVTYTLPAAAAGKQYCVGNSYNGSAPNTGALTLQTSGAGQFIIYTDGTLSASGGYVISSGAAADFGCVVGVDATHWLFRPSSGTWTKH
jgi:hypothetical protein